MSLAQPSLASRVGARIFWWTTALVSIAMALFSYRYVLGGGPVAEFVMSNLHFRPWVAVHAGAAATALLVGSFQFLPNLRTRFRALHRLLGRIYVIGCLVGGTSGLVLAFGASTGPISTAGFGALAILWLGSTALAWRHAVKRDLARHRSWMIRSFALCLAAVTLRLYLPLGATSPFGFENAYRAISFLCWVPNLIIAEIYLARSRPLTGW